MSTVEMTYEEKSRKRYEDFEDFIFSHNEAKGDAAETIFAIIVNEMKTAFNVIELAHSIHRYAILVHADSLATMEELTCQKSSLEYLKGIKDFKVKEKDTANLYVNTRYSLDMPWETIGKIQGYTELVDWCWQSRSDEETLLMLKNRHVWSLEHWTFAEDALDRKINSIEREIERLDKVRENTVLLFREINEWLDVVVWFAGDSVQHP